MIIRNFFSCQIKSSNYINLSKSVNYILITNEYFLIDRLEQQQYQKLQDSISKRNKKERAKKKVKVPLEGKINVNVKPKFLQVGTIVQTISDQYYLCCTIGKVEKLPEPDERDSYNSFIILEFGGQYERTKTIYDSIQPNFQETLYFPVPVDKSDSNFKQKLKDQLNQKFVLKIDLWNETQDNQESLGSCNFYISEIAKQQSQELTYFYDQENLNKDYKSRVFQGKKKLISAYKNMEPLINLTIWFLPDIPLMSELKDLPILIKDDIPHQLYDILEHDEKNERFEEFDKILVKNFEAIKLQDIRKQNQRNYIFVFDQYKRKHLLSLYIGKISPPTSNNNINQEQIEQNQESIGPQKKKKKKKGDEDIENGVYLNGVNTLEEISHFVHSIPYIRSSSQKGVIFKALDLTSVWTSPDFFLQSKRGGTIEHAVLLANMFSACSSETRIEFLKRQINMDSKIKKTTTKSQRAIIAEFNPFSIENRIFLCIGTLKKSMEPHVWVMTYSANFKDVVMWEARTGEKFVLPRRVQEEQRGDLMKFCSPNFMTLRKLVEEYQDQMKDKSIVHTLQMQMDIGDFIKFSGIQTQDEIKEVKIEKKVIKKKKDINVGMIDNKKAAQEKERLEQQKKNRMLKYLKNIEEISDDEQDDLNVGDDGEKFNKQELLIPLQNVQQNLRIQNFKDVGGEAQLDIQARNLLSKDDEKEGGQKMSKEAFREEQERQQKLKEEGRKDKHLLPVNTFYYEDNTAIKEVFLPYETIEVIFNNKNIWINMKNHDPAKIHYNLNLSKEWLPYLLYDDKVENENTPQDEEVKSERHTWNQILPQFFRSRTFLSAMSINDVQIWEKAIYQKIKFKLSEQRGMLNLSTKYRPQTDRFLKDISVYLVDWENYMTGKIKKQIFEEKIAKWKIQMLKYCPDEYWFKAQPMYFNELNADKISEQIITNCKEFIYVQEKKIIYAISTKIFPFPQRVNSIRVMMIMVYAKPSTFQSRKKDIKKQVKKIEEQKEDTDDDEDEDEEDEDDQVKDKDQK